MTRRKAAENRFLDELESFVLPGAKPRVMKQLVLHAKTDHKRHARLNICTPRKKKREIT